jgi:hypothetical protein
MCLEFGFVIFWRKDFGTKAAHKMMVKLPPGDNFISMFTCSFFAKDKKLLVFENEFHHAFSSQNCGSCDIRKSHLAVLVAICKSQLVVLKKALKKPCVIFFMKSAPSDRK